MVRKLVFTQEEEDKTGVSVYHTWASELGPLKKILDLMLNQPVWWSWCPCLIWTTHPQTCNMTTKGMISLELSFLWTWIRTFSFCLEEVLEVGGEGQRIKSPVFETQFFSLSHMAKVVRVKKQAWKTKNWLYHWLKGQWPKSTYTV